MIPTHPAEILQIKTESVESRRKILQITTESVEYLPEILTSESVIFGRFGRVGKMICRILILARQILDRGGGGEFEQRRPLRARPRWKWQRSGWLENPAIDQSILSTERPAKQLPNDFAANFAQHKIHHATLINQQLSSEAKGQDH